MAPVNKSASSSSKTRSSTSEPHLKRVKGENFYRNAKQAARVKMLNGGKPVRDRDGKIIEAAAFQKGESETKPGRVQPDRRWFGNTRVISQTALEHFRTSLGSRKDDPYSVLLRRNKLPMALLDDAQNPNARKRSHIVETEPFAETFGPKAQRKKARIDAGTFEELGKLGAAAADDAELRGDTIAGPSNLDAATKPAEESTHADLVEHIYAKGTSRRIYGELYKVIDSSDVILHILDARDPLGTLCESVLAYMRKEKAHKQVVLVLNKCDLVPAWVTQRYIQHLTPRYPTLAFHASPNHAFGKGALIQLLRQFSQLHSDKKQISVGFIGYPNVGKSSVINTLKSGKVCTVAPIPGETKVWQYITLTRRIYLIDCPGIVPASAHDTQTSTVLKGVVRVEALPTPSEHVPALLTRVKPVYLARTYGLALPEAGAWESEAFLDILARKKGRLLKGGEPDMDGVAKILLSDWVRGRIPFFVPPPERSDELNVREAKEKARAARKAGAKGKAKEEVEEDEEEPAPMTVKQNLKSMMQKMTFVPEDVRPIEEDEEAVEEDNNDEEAGSDSGEEVGEGEDEEEEDEFNGLSWGDVFPEGNGTEGTKVPSTEASDELEDDDTPDEPATKEKRMTTNKRKSKNFYSDTNVKNKNRDKAKTMKSLPVGRKARR